MRHGRQPGTAGWKRLALALAVLLLLLHSAGEAFHFRAHLPVGADAPGVSLAAATDALAAVSAPRDGVTSPDDCALCALAGCAAVVMLAAALALLVPGLRPAAPTCRLATRPASRPAGRAPPRAPPVFA